MLVDKVIAFCQGVGADIKAIYTSLAGKADKEYVQSRGNSLVTNGTGLLGDNTNFSAYTFDPSTAYAANGSFRYTSGQTTAYLDEYIPVDPSKKYRLTYAVKNTNPLRSYFGVACFDADRNAILPIHTLIQSGTKTELAAPLTPGDTTVTLVSASGWNNGPTAHQRTLAIWPYTSPITGQVYEEYTYTRNVRMDAWAQGGISGNVITLSIPWTFANPDDPNGTWPIGTKVSNNASGGQYKYIAGSDFATTEWGLRSGYISGIDLTSTNQVYSFQPGTASVRLLGLLNYGTGGGTTWFSNIDFHVEQSTNDYTDADKTKLDSVETGATANYADETLLNRFYHTGQQSISTITGLATELSEKVDVVAGKQLSTEDYTAIEKSKLAGIEAGAEVNPVIVNTLTSTATAQPLSANQGRELKGLIDTINSLLQSDDSTLDELQEIVDYVKLNRADLSALGISSIAGLSAALAAKASTATNITAGNGLTGGGDLSATRTVTLGTPSSITGATGNTVSSTTHTHAISVTKSDVGLANVDNTSDANKPVSTAQQTALSTKVDKTNTVSAGNGLTGGGNLTGAISLTLGTPGTLSGTTTNQVTTTGHTHAISDASTTTRGVIEIATAAEVSALSSSTLAVTPSTLGQVLEESPGRLLAVWVITSSRTYMPSSQARYLIVEGVGGGGAGGSAQGTPAGYVSAAMGGGAGGYFRQRINAPTSSLVITIGAGGSRGVAGLIPGGDGGTTSFGSLFSATGGSGGNAGPAIAAGVAIPSGLASTPGGTATAGLLISANGGDGKYGLALGQYQIYGGAGGDSMFGAGAPATPVNTSHGIAAISAGSGGSGAACFPSVAAGRYGGNGAKGLVIVYEYS